MYATRIGGPYPSLANSLGSRVLSLGIPSLSDFDTDSILKTLLGHGSDERGPPPFPRVPLVSKPSNHASDVYYPG